MGMALFFADDMDKVSREELQQIIWHGAWHKKVEGDLTGIFRYRPRWFWQRRDPRDRWRVLEVREVQQLTISPEPGMQQRGN
jgi:hypothetical protein